MVVKAIRRVINLTKTKNSSLFLFIAVLVKLFILVIKLAVVLTKATCYKLISIRRFKNQLTANNIHGEIANKMVRAYADMVNLRLWSYKS